MLAGMAWLGPGWVAAPGASDVVRSLGHVMTPFFVPLVVHLVVMLVRIPGRPSSTGRAVLVLYLATAILSVGRGLTYVPFDDRYCAWGPGPGTATTPAAGSTSATRLPRTSGPSS